MKKFRAAKLTFEGKILQRIIDLSNDKSQNGFEIIVLTKGLVNELNLNLLDLMYISVEDDGDFLILNYPDYINCPQFK